jgi:ABC-2 type transport system ATP-binding protein
MHVQATSRRPAIEVRELAKTFDGTVALRGASFDAHPGELLAVIGPNGAGKTTLLSILAGVQRSDAGSFEAGGRIGWVPQGMALYHRLTVEENLRLFARLEGVGDLEDAVERMLEQTGLRQRRAEQVANLSGGNQQRVNIAAGLLSEPAILLLDEPSRGLDPRQRERLWDFVLGLAGGGTTVVFSTHHLPEAERYAMRLLVLVDGACPFVGTADELRAAAPPSARADLETAFVAYVDEHGN